MTNDLKEKVEELKEKIEEGSEELSDLKKIRLDLYTKKIWDYTNIAYILTILSFSTIVIASLIIFDSFFGRLVGMILGFVFSTCLTKRQIREDIKNLKEALKFKNKLLKEDKK